MLVEPDILPDGVELTDTLRDADCVMDGVMAVVRLALGLGVKLLLAVGETVDVAVPEAVCDEVTLPDALTLRLMLAVPLPLAVCEGEHVVVVDGLGAPVALTVTLTLTLCVTVAVDVIVTEALPDMLPLRDTVALPVGDADAERDAVTEVLTDGVMDPVMAALPEPVAVTLELRLGDVELDGVIDAVGDGLGCNHSTTYGSAVTQSVSPMRAESSRSWAQSEGSYAFDGFPGAQTAAPAGTGAPLEKNQAPEGSKNAAFNLS